MNQITEEELAWTLRDLVPLSNEDVKKAAAIAIRELCGWRPIGEAPKDGSTVLIAWFDKTNNKWQQRSSYWDATFDFTYDDIRGSTQIGAWTDNAVASFAYEETHSYPATHFRPLPPPPQNETANGD